MDEALLQFIWKHRLLKGSLLTMEKEPVSVLHPGEHNLDAGPDFFNARLMVGDTMWAGNVELHLKTSDWEKHHHSGDARYKHIVLHVVYEHDREVDTNCPVLQLKEHISTGLLEQYRDLMKNLRQVACEHLLPEVKPITLKSWLDRLTAERMEDKCRPLLELLQQNKNNFEEAFYITLMRSMGLKVNTQAFELTARSLPLKVLSRHKHSLIQTEALLFGCAGLLQGMKKPDAYCKELFNEFQFLKHKYGLKPVPIHYWKWLRLRPSNFPEVRLAQTAALVHNSSHLLSHILKCDTVKDLRNLFHAAPSAYWDTHYHLNRASAKKKKNMGEDFLQLLFINSIIPFVFLYGKLRDDEALKEKALSWLEQLPAEDNAILRMWAGLGIQAEHAADSQALLKLKKDYCNFTRCLSCQLGREIISRQA